jgi:hypothetical protein
MDGFRDRFLSTFSTGSAAGPSAGSRLVAGTGLTRIRE